jgi:hypothetical protein
MIIRMNYNTVVVPMADGEVISSLLWHASRAMSLAYTAFLKLCASWVVLNE